MTQDSESVETRPKPPPLKAPELPVNEKQPWSDDVLERKEVADRLTRIIEGQEVPFVISVDGGWGTGKTFLLRRWQQDLENRGWQAIYFNAWEDDFASDPLISITGQFSEHFEKRGQREVVRELVHLGLALVDLAAPLTPYGPVWAWLRGAARKLGSKQAPSQDMRRYLERRTATDDFRRTLTRLGAEVREDTGQPLVFIIDELDRCRPTFAIELLERVKHIFDVPNIVFVFGINRSELVKALESVYGEIDAAMYLRRFFDMEFVLPEPQPGDFCRHLLRSYGLDVYFSQLSGSWGEALQLTEYQGAAETLPLIFSTMGLSLRDMDYCVRLLSLAAREPRPGQLLSPELFGVLAALKIADQELYRGFVDGDARGADVINYINKRRLREGAGAPFRSNVATNPIDRIEALLYAADGGGLVYNEIEKLKHGGPLEYPQYIASHHLRLNHGIELEKHHLLQLQANVRQYDNDNLPLAVAALAQKIDIYEGSVRR